MADILQVRQLTKRFGNKVAVDELSFVLKSGQCFGLLGPNGAGKTTTIEMLEGVLAPDDGEILFHGKPRSSDFRQAIGIQFQSTALQERLNVLETLKLFSRLYESPLPLAELMNRCQLDELAEQDTHKLSGGQRQRLLLAIALINDPQLLFLDEPTTGLDPQARLNFWKLVEQIKADGKTVLLTTHYMDEAHYLCDEIGIVDKGKLIARDTPQRLLEQYIPGIYLSVSADYAEVLDKLGIEYERQYGWCRWKCNDVKAQIDHLQQAGLQLGDIQIQRPDLDDLFLTLTGRSLRS
ncbi:ABC transporter ATP-binding protein [Celerinatantimonas sp. MCCC 1A17872]|uniref:ABC transporter ATP-binding protein n=1 Tax=Celerinatantimonas sp. MCCC 1A17872 TaxID=3177514 RepID=UPI0038BF442D